MLHTLSNPIRNVLSIGLLLAATQLHAQSPLTATGKVNVNGQPQPYIIHHLPLAAFPDLPAPIAQALAAHNCTIPQSFEARGPENVIHGSFEHPGSTDWAALCSADGQVSLIVFFSSAPDKPTVVATAAETDRLQPHPGTPELGFNWAIDPAPPSRIREAQAGQQNRLHPDHDALSDTTLDRQTRYHYFDNNSWTEFTAAQ